MHLLAVLEVSKELERYIAAAHSAATSSCCYEVDDFEILHHLDLKQAELALERLAACCKADYPVANQGHLDSSSVAGACSSVGSASSLVGHTGVVVVGCKRVVASSCWVVVEVLADAGKVVAYIAAAAVEEPPSACVVVVVVVVDRKMDTLVVQHQQQEQSAVVGNRIRLD